MSEKVEMIKKAIRESINWNKPYQEIRADLDNFGRSIPADPDVTVKKEYLNGVAVEILEPNMLKSDKIVLYVHGGGFCIGISNINRAFVSKIAKDLGMVTYFLDYRLAPENPYPDGLNDFIACYKHLAAKRDPGKSIVILADSSGAALALSGLQLLEKEKVSMPIALGLMTPVVDLAKTGASFKTNKQKDPYHLLEDYFIDNNYLVSLNPKDPTVSPIYGDFFGLPPMIIHSAGCDVFCSDAEMLVQKATSQGVLVLYHEWPELWHNFHMSSGLLEEGEEALKEIYRFINDRADSKL